MAVPLEWIEGMDVMHSMQISHLFSFLNRGLAAIRGTYRALSEKY